MTKKSASGGLSGILRIDFAIPTDEATVWRRKHGTITFESSRTTAIEVEDGYVPQAKGTQGLTVTYYVFQSVKKQGSRITGDVAMTTCINGRFMDTVDVAHGVTILASPEMSACLAESVASKV